MVATVEESAATPQQIITDRQIEEALPRLQAALLEGWGAKKTHCIGHIQPQDVREALNGLEEDWRRRVARRDDIIPYPPTIDTLVQRLKCGLTLGPLSQEAEARAFAEVAADAFTRLEQDYTRLTSDTMHD